MSYCFINLREESDGSRCPDFPEGSGFLLLADSRPMNYGLYAYSLDDEHEHWKPEHPAGAELSALLASCRQYPPALALAREEISRKFRTREPDVEEFRAAMIESVGRHLANQSEAGYVLAPSRVMEIGYLHPAEWQWVLGVSKKDPGSVLWVSDDYFIYANLISHFAFTGAQLCKLGIEVDDKLSQLS